MTVSGESPPPPKLEALEGVFNAFRRSRIAANFEGRQELVEQMHIRFVQAAKRQLGGYSDLDSPDDLSKHHDPVPIFIDQDVVQCQEPTKFVSIRYADEYDNSSLTASGDVLYIYIPVLSSFSLDPFEATPDSMFEAIMHNHEAYVSIEHPGSKLVQTYIYRISAGGVEQKDVSHKKGTIRNPGIDARNELHEFIVDTMGKPADITAGVSGDIVGFLGDKINFMDLFPHKVDYGDTDYSPKIKY